MKIVRAHRVGKRYVSLVISELRFDKYHGIGNDFLVIRVEKEVDLSVSRAMELCDRHFGVGGDGVLLVSPPRTKGARASMTVINSDGSIPEMCGNGLRCVAAHLCREAGESEGDFLVDTGAGPLRCELVTTGEGYLIGTEIGTGTYVGDLVHEQAGEEYRFVRIATGNPHAVCFREPLEPQVLDELGPAVSGRIEEGANVEIATLHSPQEIELSVWERGVGRTLACGTGAAATAIAAVRSGKSPFDQPILVRLPGGPLSITVTQSLKAHLRGPAEWVYSGITRV